MAIFSSKDREQIIQALTENTFDVLVIGGGITGAGIALDATTRGMKTALVEMQDFAAGTSSRSTKLVHGGLRYLQQFEVKLVAEVGKERAIVYENGPHVTTPEWMMLPIYKGGTFNSFTTNIGLRLYDFLAGVKRSERRQMLSRDEALRNEPLIRQDQLKGAGYYVEYKTDDARLTIEVLKKAVEKGAFALNYLQVIDFTRNEKRKINGVQVKDVITNKTYQIRAKKMINAGGPWVDQIRELDQVIDGKRLQHTKGVHLVFKKERFPLQQAIYFDAFDGRMIFAIPRGDHTYVGTTDTMYEGKIERPRTLKEDRDYLLKVINDMFPSLKIVKEDIQSSWAGLRPLIAAKGKKPGEISRKEEIFISESGLISMAGGKLTGYRKMAEQAVDLVVKQFKEEEHILYSDSVTEHLPISGGDVGGSKQFEKFKVQKIMLGIALGLAEDEAQSLVQMYGSNIDQLYEIYQSAEVQEATMNKIILTELIYAIHYEASYKLEDFFIRRTGALFFDIDTVLRHKQDVIQYMSEELNWNDIEKAHYKEELDRFIDEAKNAQ